MKHTHGGNIYDFDTITYDFSANVNPLGMPEAAKEKIKQCADSLSSYPDIKGRNLKRQIALHDGVAVPHIVLGNGVGELIYGICNALRPERCLVLAPTFSEYEAAMSVYGCKLSRMNLKEENHFGLTRQEITDLFSWIRKTSGKRMIFFCNPNNPTGVVIEKQLMIRIADVCEQAGVYLCVDECFLPFMKEEDSYSLKTEVHAYKHLIVLRGFTKFYGMAGLRLGYLLSSSKELLSRIDYVLPPWNTSTIAQLAGIEALQDEAYESETRELIEQERQYLMENLKNGLVSKVYPSCTNYILFKAEPSLYNRLLEDGILIRDCRDYVNLGEGYFRIAVRSHEENVALIKALRKRLEQ